MDGLPQRLSPATNAVAQHTLKTSIGCVGVGLHSGCRVRLTLRSADPGHGIVFRRVDLGRDIPARFDRVVDSRLSTTLANAVDPGCRVGTVEHVMAALAGVGIDNALIELDGPEPPILDGSASPYVFLIDCAGSVAQSAPRRVMEILRPIRVTDGEASVELRPCSAFDGFEMTLSIEFAVAAIGQQSVALRFTPESFRHQLSRARTFALAEDVTRLRDAGLAQGGSLDNAVVVDQSRILNPGGLRMPDEFACHKLLDAVGDLALAGAALRGHFIAHRSGHALNNRLLHATFADPSAWRMTEGVIEPATAAA
ncbi:MAG: UDP-3-O-acyl-N-acetylglucosamine deacetylase [Pseudomonadota bacterium]|nr:UDP-3-O-acyl-N-acetylglucosamine deacetylase [Pseudomonadota bacterium]